MLVDRGLVADLDVARELIAAGRVLVDGAPATTRARGVSPSEAVVVLETTRFVGRGGEKLDAALEGFDIDVAGGVALDLGASTGGFTDCLLQRGVLRVLAVDVGTHQLHERLRRDPRVTSLEQTNLRDLDPAQVEAVLGGPPDVVTVDLSFTSVVPLTPRLVSLASPGATVLVLVKPQFEVDHATASRGKGVVSDRGEWLTVLERAASTIERSGAGIMGLMASPLKGASGNVEFFVHARVGRAPAGAAGVARMVDAAVERVGGP